MKIQLDNKVYDVDTNQPVTDFIADTGLSEEKAAFLYEIAASINEQTITDEQ